MRRTLPISLALFATLICGVTARAAGPQFGPTRYYPIAPSVYRNGTFLKAVDTNGDSFTDLIVISPGGSQVSVLFGDKSGTFKNRLDSDIGAIVYSGGNAAEGDFNMDGHPDLVIAMNRGPLRLMLGDGKGKFTGDLYLERVGPNPDCAGPLFAADINRDGKLDIVASQCQGGIGVFLGGGNGTFAPPLRVPIPSLNRSVDQTMALADFNQDKIPDVAVATLTGVAVLAGNGDGTFREPVLLDTGCPLKLIVADVNRDGRDDLIVLPVDLNVRPAPMFGSAGNGVNVYLGDGNGGFKTLPPFPAVLSAFSLEGGFPFHVEVADLTGDLVPDLVISKQQFSPETAKTAVAVLVLAGQGDGTFARAGEFRNTPASRKYPQYTFALADVNGDRKMDLIFLDDRSGTQVGVALNTAKTQSPGNPKIRGSLLCGEGCSLVAVAN